MRVLRFGWLALALISCRPTPPASTAAADKATKSHIYAGDFLASRENCGLIHNVRPTYPAGAKRARTQGIVRLAISITKAGDVRDIQLLSGDSALAPAAIDAVKQWRYAPCILNGEPLEVKTEVDIQFTLNQ